MRLPKEFRLATDEVEIFRRGDEIVLREKTANLEPAFHLLCSPPNDSLPDKRLDGPPQARDEL